VSASEISTVLGRVISRARLSENGAILRLEAFRRQMLKCSPQQETALVNSRELVTNNSNSHLLSAPLLPLNLPHMDDALRFTLCYCWLLTVENPTGMGSTVNRQNLQFLGALCICSLTLISQPATAALVFDANVTPNVIFGSGNANGSFTVDQNNGVELGLRGKLRYNAVGVPENTFNSNGDGTYSFAAGVAPTQTSPTAVWSFEWSINSDYLGTANRNLDDITYLLGYDSDPGAGTSWSGFDPVNDPNPGAGDQVFWDHALGDNSTANGAGSSATSEANYATLIGANNVAQNSWKPHWFLSGFDPTVDGQYDFFLTALDGTGAELARTDMSIIVGAGASVVPVPAAVWLFGTALIGLVGFGKRRKTAS
jgi:hypothetical protein